MSKSSDNIECPTFTVLQRPGGFTTADSQKVTLKTWAPAFIWNKDNTFLLIAGEINKDTLSALFPEDDFEHQIIEGYDDLPVPFTQETFQGHIEQMAAR